MPEAPKTNRLSRRELLISSAALAIGLTRSPASIWAAVAEAGPASASHPQLLAELCDAVIPATDTPGASEAGVAAFVELAAAHGLEEAPADLVDRFAAGLNQQAGGEYLALSADERSRLLGEIDTRSFDDAQQGLLPEAMRSWPTLKALIVIGYYTSEIGASQELRYKLVPGRFDPDVPFEPGDRAWSSDWVGVKYA